MKENKLDIYIGLKIDKHKILKIILYILLINRYNILMSIFTLNELDYNLLDKLKINNLLSLLYVNKYYSDVVSNYYLISQYKKFKILNSNYGKSSNDLVYKTLDGFHYSKNQLMMKKIYKCINNNLNELLIYMYNDQTDIIIKLENEDVKELINKCFSISNTKILKWLINLKYPLDYTEIFNYNIMYFGNIPFKIIHLLYTKCDKELVSYNTILMKGIHNIETAIWLYDTNKINKNQDQTNKYMELYNNYSKNKYYIDWLYKISYDKNSYCNGIVNIDKIAKELFYNLCYCGDFDSFIWLYNNYKHLINIHNDNDRCFRLACNHGDIKKTKWLYKTFPNINIHANNDESIIYSYVNEKYDVFKWLFKLDKVNNIKNKKLIDNLYWRICSSKEIESIKYINKLINKYCSNDIYNDDFYVNNFNWYIKLCDNVKKIQYYYYYLKQMKISIDDKKLLDNLIDTCKYKKLNQKLLSFYEYIITLKNDDYQKILDIIINKDSDRSYINKSLLHNIIYMMKNKSDILYIEKLLLKYKNDYHVFSQIYDNNILYHKPIINDCYLNGSKEVAFLLYTTYRIDDKILKEKPIETYKMK